MNQSSEKALNYLTGSNHLSAVKIEDLQKIALESPYFPVTQFLLAQKLKEENKPEFDLQVQKTSLYFSNPLWLHYQLTEGQTYTEQSDSELDTFADRQVVEDDALNPATEAPAVIEPFVPPVASVDVPTVTPNTGEIEQQLHRHGPPEGSLEKEQSSIAPPQHLPLENVDAEVPDTTQVEEEIAATTRDTSEVTDEFIEHLVPEKQHPVSIAQQELPAAAQQEVTQVEEEMAGAISTTDVATQQFLHESQTKAANDPLTPEDEHDRMFQNIKAMLDASSEEAGADTRDALIPIDPYYTIDYFASQGIKLELDQNPQDQLGQNLKKFTHWLRHMKKLGPEDATEVISRTESDADIQQFADSSNTVREVVTEAMASVLEKQGKNEKAIELYNKLSFLNPHKSAYFADKIKKLKGT